MSLKGRSLINKNNTEKDVIHVKKLLASLLFTSVVSVLIYQSAFTIEPIPIMFHVHSIYSDGHFSPIQLKDEAQMRGYRGIFFSEHTDCFVTRWAMLHRDKKYILDVIDISGLTIHQHPAVNSFSDYWLEINDLINQDGVFIALAGREITVDKDPRNSFCHINAISFVPDPYLYTNKYSPDDLPALLRVLDKEGAIYIYNHPHQCPLLEKYAYLFHGIEMMNDFTLSWNFDQVAKRNYQYHLGIFLDLMKRGLKKFVVGGIDFHMSSQWTVGKIITYVFPDKFTQRGVFNALSEGRTVATRNLELIEINQYPSLITNLVDDKIVISGKIQVPLRFASNLILNVYKDGEKHVSIDLKKEGTAGSKVIYSFYFLDDNVPSKETSYVLEIPYHLISSPYYFALNTARLPDIKEREEGNQGVTAKGVPGKVFRIINVEYDPETRSRLISTENNEYTDHIPFYDICHDDFLYTPQGLIAGCRNPLFTVANFIDENGEQRVATIRGGKECNIILPIEFLDNECTEAVKDSFIVEIGKHDYRAVKEYPFVDEFLVVTQDRLKVEDRLFLCDTSGNFVFNNEGNLVDCDIKYGPIQLMSRPGKTLLRTWLGISLENYFLLVKKD